MVHCECNLCFSSGLCSIPTPVHFMMGTWLSCCHLSWTCLVKWSCIAAALVVDWLHSKISWIILPWHLMIWWNCSKKKKTKKLDVMSAEGLPLPPLCGDNVLVNPHLFPVVAHILSVVCSIWECLRMLNPYHNVVEAAETTGVSGSDLEVDFRSDRSLISV